MCNLMPRDITMEVQNILKRVPVNSNGRGRSYLTAYQILEQLPHPIRERLVTERGNPGKNSGNYYAAANVVSDAAEMITNIDIAFLDTSSLKINLNVVTIDGTNIITPGNPNVGLYRLV